MKQKNTDGKFKLNEFIKLIKATKPKYWQLWIGLILGLIGTFAQLIVPKVAQSMVNNFSKGINGALIAGVIIIFITSAVISAMSGTLLGFFGENVVANLRNLLWRKLLRLPVSYFDTVKTGKMTSRLVNDSDQIKNLLAVSFPNSINSVFQLIGALIIMLVMDWKMTLIMFIAIPLVMVVMRPVMKQARIVGRARQDELAEFTGKSEDTLGEIRLVKSSNSEEYESDSGNKMIHKLYKIGFKEAVYDSIASPLMGTVMMALIVGILGYGAHRVVTGSMTIGTMFAFLMYLFQVIGPVGTLGRFATDLSKANGSTDRVRELMKEPEEDLISGINKDVSEQNLNLNNINFAYEPKSPILNDVSITAKPNTTVAFVGPSGSGKSTIFSLIERYYSPQNGEIKIGDTKIQDINLTDWRKQIGFVSQDSSIMAGTIRHNLTYGLDVEFSDDQLWAVLKLAYADNFVKKMPEGLNTELGERGIKVSGGQRQRLAIARAFLRDPKILMLDEATASLDSQSEAMVQKALDSLMENRTTLTIAHRLSTIVDADQIYFIENGKVSGHGTHEELLNKLDVYKEYVKIQFNK